MQAKVKTVLAGVTCAIGAGALMSNAAAQETVTIKFATGVPATHFISAVPAKFFMDRVVELSKGRVKFEFYPGEQLGKAKDMLSLVQTGVAEMADIVPSYVPDKLPLTGVTELPGQTNNSCEGTKTYYALTRPGKILATKTFDPQKVRVLMAATIVPYKVVTSKKAVRTLEDLAGLKIRTTGGVTDDTMRALGAVSVRLSGAEIREAATRGTIDGALYTFMSVKSFGLSETIKFATEGASLGTVSDLFVFNEEKFGKLPADLQKILEQAGKEAGEHYCQWMDAQEGKEKTAATGIQTIQLAPAEAARWNAKLEGSKQEWGSRMDKRGNAGSEALKAWDEEIKKVRAGN